VPGAPPPQPGNFNQGIAPTAAWPNLLDIWITPWGFVKGATANSATVRSQRIGGKSYRVVSWTPLKKSPSGQDYRIVGYVNDQNLIDRVETWVEHPVLGDMHVEASYSGYQDFGGIKVPTRIVQKRGGLQTFEATITAASANPANIAELLQPPAPARRLPCSRKRWARGCIASRVDTSRSPSSSRTTSWCWKAARTKRAASR
jgi:hypothetical protein